MYYRNLIEDEKEALNERRYKRIAGAMVFLGILLVLINLKKF
jgi:hypothetical protein